MGHFLAINRPPLRGLGPSAEVRNLLTRRASISSSELSPPRMWVMTSPKEREHCRQRVCRLTLNNLLRPSLSSKIICGFFNRGGIKILPASLNSSETMIGESHCPFCKAPAAKGCAHLALATEAREFVRRCVELCQGHLRWQALCMARQTQARQTGEWSPEKEDFTWLETAFCKEFLQALRWFGGMDYEWRTGPKRKQGGFWVLLWSKNPQRLWWELLDEFERQCSKSPAGPSLPVDSALIAPKPDEGGLPTPLLEWSSVRNPSSHPRPRRPL